MITLEAFYPHASSLKPSYYSSLHACHLIFNPDYSHKCPIIPKLCFLAFNNSGFILEKIATNLYIIILHSTKYSRDKTFAVRSPCEYSWKNFHDCIKNFLILAITLENLWAKHLRFQVKLQNPRTFCPSNVLFYTVILQNYASTCVDSLIEDTYIRIGYSQSCKGTCCLPAIHPFCLTTIQQLTSWVIIMQ